MTPFLQLVAQKYIDNEGTDLADFCFVFPNQRSATFFRRYLRRESRRRNITLMSPEAITIERLAGRLVPELSEASHLDQLFTLYKEYRELSEDPQPFDRFRFWGDLLLNDFNDVDRYMVDARALYTNVKRYREISSTFLEPRQLEVIRRYWHDDFIEYSPDQFWRHMPHDERGGGAHSDDSPSAKYMRLWQMLSPLYTNFHKALAAESLATSGRIFRTAVERLRLSSELKQLDAGRYIFVGFNVLTTVESRLFSRLKLAGKADFYWDLANPMLLDTSNHALQMVRANVDRFPSIYPLSEEQDLSDTEITIVGVPSKNGQAKYIGTMLGEYVDKGYIADSADAIDTAVVLPDESMLVPMIQAVPERITKVNVTMGLPMRQNPVSSLIRRIVALHLHTRVDRTTGLQSHYFADVTGIATHPLLQSAAAEECAALVTAINLRHLIMVPVDDIIAVAPSLAPIFDRVTDPYDFGAVAAYLRGVLEFVRQKLAVDVTIPTDFPDPADIDSPDESEPEDDDSTTLNSASRQVYVVVDAYLAALDELEQALSRHDIEIGESTVMQMVESAVNSQTIRFSGEPLAGLQIMGMLETRALDFENVIVLSMNERIYPRRHHSGSFIPEALRAAYGMSTNRFREAATAYNFFRLLTRAKRITLLYDNRTAGTRSGEMSRYMSQMLMLFGGNNIRHITVGYSVNHHEPKPVSIAKDDSVWSKLMKFTEPDPDNPDAPGKFKLSPSAINRYIECPLNFYLSYIEGMNPAEEIPEFIDSSTYGTIIHSVVEQLYISQRQNPRDNEETVLVTSEMLDSFLGTGKENDSENTPIAREVRRAINRFYKKRAENYLYRLGVEKEIQLNEDQRRELERELDTPLQGDSYALGVVMVQNVRRMLREEKKFLPFEFISGELRQGIRLKVNDELTVNYTQVIDRVDALLDRSEPEGRLLRIVDYKTGSDPTDFRSIDDLFNESGSGNRPKAILQLLLYCNVYSQATGFNKAIKPLLYSFRSMATDGIRDIRMSGEVVDDYRMLNDRFFPMLMEKIAEIFDRDKPFTAAASDHACKYCNFKEICHKL